MKSGKRLSALILSFFMFGMFFSTSNAASVSELMHAAFEPIGKCLYVYGGGWNEPDTGAGEEALQIGLGEKWEQFYNSKNSAYDYNTTRYQIHDGLDCTGYVGWCMYQLFENKYSDQGYVFLANEMAKKYSDIFGGEFVSKNNVKKRRCGDIMSSGGHAYIVVGECADGSVVFLHASPPALTLCGTSTPDGIKNSEAVRLAQFYMNIYFNECYTKYPYCSKGTDYLTNYNQMIWSDTVLSDSDGYREMYANDILRDIFSTIKVYLHGERLAKGYNIYNINSTIFVPANVICEKLGVTVNQTGDEIKLQKNDSVVELKNESDVASINGKNTKLNYKVFMVENNIYVPIRTISEAFGLTVTWKGNVNAVFLN